MRVAFTIGLFVCAATLGSFGAAEPVIPHRQDSIPNEPYAPEEARKRMVVPPGFSVELVASEPDLVNPIAMTFDDRGRIWVTESLEYPRKSAGPGRDRIKILEDTDGDGHAEKITVFAQDLNIPTGIAIGHGGVWVLNAPDLLYLKDGDGKQLSREVVVTGFGRTDTHELPNSLTWGPDGWLYGLNGVFNQSHIQQNGKEFRFTCAMWRLHPRTREFQLFAEGTSNPYGIAWNAEGSAIIEACHWANDHLFHFVETGYYQRQAGAYPPFAWKLGSITTHSHQKTAYCGISFLDTDAYPAAYRERIVVGNIHGGCLNVDALQRDGSTYLATAEPDLLNASDVWFMPVCLKVGPDGCLYVLDWYDRYHCYQDAGRDPDGIDRLKGRLYRVRYGEKRKFVAPNLATESDDQLILRLGSPNIYFRETAQRLLSERNQNATRDKLERLIAKEDAPRKARLHALWALIGAGSLGDVFHANLLKHGDSAFRAWAVRAAGNFRVSAPPFREGIRELAFDSSPDVLLQIAIAAPKLPDFEPMPVLVQVLRSCGQDKIVPAVVWQNLHRLLEQHADAFADLCTEKDLRDSPGLQLVLPRAVERILQANPANLEAVKRLARAAIRSQTDGAKDVLGAIASKFDQSSPDGRKQVADAFTPLLNEAADLDSPLSFSAKLLRAKFTGGAGDLEIIRQKLLSPSEKEATRIQALEALVSLKPAFLLADIEKFLGADFNPKALPILGRIDDPKFPDLLIRRYANFAPEVQPLIVELIMQREPSARKLLDAVTQEKLPRTVLNANYLRKILESNDREALWAVEKIWGKVREERNPEREKVVAEMGRYLREHPGNAPRGEGAFQRLCAQCHTIYGRGGNVGPDLTGNGRSSFDQLLSNVFDPSLVIGPGYQVTTVVTRDGRNLTGLITEDSDRGITIKMPGEGEEFVARNQVKYTRASKLSMMPEGLETFVDRKELSDLFAFLCLDKPPTDASAKPIPGAPFRK